MAILINNISIIYKISSICLNEDGTCDITLSNGYDNLGIFTKIGIKRIHVPVEDVNYVLSKAPSGLTRKTDIGNAIYTYLVDKGHIVGELV